MLSHSGDLPAAAARAALGMAPAAADQPAPAPAPAAAGPRPGAPPIAEPAAATGATDAPAPETLVELTPAVWRVLRRTGVTRDELDDGLQTVLVQLCRRWAQLRALPPDELRAYACCAAAGVATDVARRRGRERARLERLDVDPADSAPGADDALARKRARASLDRILVGMPEERRVVFVLYELEELTAPQIAEHLVVPLGTVASRLRRARRDFESAVRRLRAREDEPRRAR